jgi:hypothetical protein
MMFKTKSRKQRRKMKFYVLILAVMLLLASCKHTDAIPADSSTETETVTATAEETKAVPGQLLEKYPQLTNLPTLYIELENNKSINAVGKNYYMPGTYTLVAENISENIYEQPLSIKGRGNYSWSFEQKPYNIELDKKTGLLGMGAAKKWVLITTYSDKTLLRNYMILNLAVTAGLRGAVEVRYVDVFFNGKYNGTYVLSEKIQIHEERINVDEKKGILFEIEMQYRHGDCSDCVITNKGLHLIIKEYKGRKPQEVTKSEKDELKKIVNEAESAMSDSNSYGDYIDVESFAKWYIINEFTKNYDSNFTTSCYLYINEEGKLAMGPPWDYDTCMGNQNSTDTGTSPKGYHVRGGPWYSVLLNNSSFNKEVKNMWTKMRNDGLFDDLLASIDKLADYISESEKLNHERWPNALMMTDLRGGQSLYTYTEEVEYLRTWIKGRLEWLDGEFYDY